MYILFLKGVVHDSNPIHFLSNSANFSLQFSRCPFSVYMKKKKPLMFMHSPGSVNGKQLKQIGLHWAINTVLQEHRREGCTFVWLSSWNINNLLRNRIVDILNSSKNHWFTSPNPKYNTNQPNYHLTLNFDTELCKMSTQSSWSPCIIVITQSNHIRALTH